MRRAHPHAEGEEEEPLHVLPPECVHLLRERQAPRPIPVGHGPSEGFRRRLERTRLDEAVNRARGSRFIPFHPFSLVSGEGRRRQETRYHLSHRRTTSARFIASRVLRRLRACESNSTRFSRKGAASAMTTTRRGLSSTSA